MIGLADSADARVLAQLHVDTVTVSYRHIFPPDSSAPTVADLIDGWQAALEDPTGGVLVWRHADVIIGSVVVQSDASLPSGMKFARLHVHPDHQGRGIGIVLHDAALDLARERGIDLINLWVLEHNTIARRMYERRGWTYVPGPVFENEPAHIVDVLYERQV